MRIYKATTTRKPDKQRVYNNKMVDILFSEILTFYIKTLFGLLTL